MKNAPTLKLSDSQVKVLGTVVTHFTKTKKPHDGDGLNTRTLQALATRGLIEYREPKKGRKAVGYVPTKDGKKLAA